MKTYRPPTPWDALATTVLVFGGIFASMTASNPPDWLRRLGTDTVARSWPLVPLLLFVLCLLLGVHLLLKSRAASSVVGPLEEQYDAYLFHYFSAVALSIRVVGAHDEWFPPSRITVQSVEPSYELPVDFQTNRERVLERLKAIAQREGRMFFDGPATRLVDYSATPVDASEEKHLRLLLGRVGWYDFSVAKWNIDALRQSDDVSGLREYIDLDEVAVSGVLRHSKLTNIACTATTFVTGDGFLTYSHRSKRVSSQGGRLTSCVAENIHFAKDKVEAGEVGNELPIPYRTVIRGVEEELSPMVAEKLSRNHQRLYLLGIDFDLESFQPDFLFFVAWPESLENLRRQITRYPGRDFVEGSMHAVRLRQRELEHLLLQPGWVPGGKASVMRTAEFIAAKRTMRRGSTTEAAIGLLSEGGP